MILKFDDVIYKKTFTIQAKDEEFDIVIELTDEDTSKLSDSIIQLMQGVNTSDAIDLILFKGDTKRLKECLVGVNFSLFRQIVLDDFQNFISGSISETIKTHS